MRDTIQQLDELHTATTQGKWVCRRFEGVKFVEPGMTIDDWQFCCDSHSAWTEISEKLKRLRAWKQEAIEMIGKWSKCRDAAGCPAKLGEFESEATEREIRRLRVENYHLRSALESFKIN